MKPAPLSVQLYSLRAEIDAQGMPAILKKTADYGYVGVEFAGFKGTAPAALRAMLDDLGLKACSAHGPAPTAANLKEIVDSAHALGFTYHVTGPGFGHEVTSRETVLRAAEGLQTAAALLKREGLRFAIHNHEYEFDRAFDGVTPHDILRDHAPDVSFEVDTYWVTVGGQDPVEVLRKLGPRAPLLHIKDGGMVNTKSMTAVGQGKMDWAPIFAAADANALEWAIVELDRCDTDMAEAVRASAEFLIARGYATGRPS